MNVDIKKEDVAINPDGSIAILNPELKAKIEEISIEPEVSLMKGGTNNCHGGNCAKGCGSKLM